MWPPTNKERESAGRFTALDPICLATFNFFLKFIRSHWYRLCSLCHRSSKASGRWCDCNRITSAFVLFAISIRKRKKVLFYFFIYFFLNNYYWKNYDAPSLFISIVSQLLSVICLSLERHHSCPNRSAFNHSRKRETEGEELDDTRRMLSDSGMIILFLDGWTALRAGWLFMRASRVDDIRLH